MTSQTTDGEKSYTMEYGLNGAKTRETAGGMVTDYTYDKMGQLIQESRNGITNQYTYDSRGNRISAIINGENCSYTYDRANRLIHEDTGVLTNSYAYDKNGNMVCRLTGRYTDATVSEEESIEVFGNAETSADNTNNSEAVYYTYNKLNQLTNVQSDDGLNARYTYSPDGRRLYKTINGETIYTHNDGDNVVVEAKPDGSVTKYYRGASLIASSNGESLSRYSYDPHGSVTMINGTDAYTYDAFGNQLTSANADNPFRYCGEYYDTETGFIYLRNRYYNPSTGRFITEDPIKDGTNWYVYCGNNPVMFVDPLGLADKELRASVEAAGGTVVYNGNGSATISVNGYNNIVLTVGDGYTSWGDDGKLYVDELHLDNIIYAPTIKKARDYYDAIIDDFGKFILRTWFFGNGAETCVRSERWTAFINRNPYFKERLSWLVPKAIENGSYTIYDTSILNLTGGDGGYSSGYELINGANEEVGGCLITGQIYPQETGYQVYIQFQFNDIIDPNNQYRTDKYLSIGARMLGSNGTNYTLRISGSYYFWYTFEGGINY